MAYVEKSMACGSTFRNWFADICLHHFGLSEARVSEVVGDYRLGGTRQADGLSFTVTDALEPYPPNTDLADLLLADRTATIADDG